MKNMYTYPSERQIQYIKTWDKDRNNKTKLKMYKTPHKLAK